MRPLILVRCATCGKDFHKPLHHVKENLKLGHRFFCSRSCESRLKNKQVLLTCDNPQCGNSFKRSYKAISPRNFCSRSCSAIVNNQKSHRRKPLYKSCVNESCRNIFVGNRKYCSVACLPYKGKPPPHWSYNKTQLIEKIQVLAKKIGRAPTRRECPQASSCQKYFGSWNDAITAAGLMPHRSKSQKMYKRIQSHAKNGHYCYSVSEVIIDDWLTKHGIPHQKEVRYPESNFIADWSLPRQKIFIEYFGLAKDVENYDLTINNKGTICKNHGIKLIELYASDLFPINNLDIRFRVILNNDQSY